MRTFRLASQPWYTMTVLALSISGCAVNITDFRFCGLNPNTGNWACDNFLTSDPAILNPSEFIIWEQSVESSGQVIEVTTSNALGSIKTELEQLCTKTSCTYPTQQALKKAIKELDFRVDAVKRRSLEK